MSDASTAAAAPRFRGPYWELERAQMLFLAWRLGDATLRELLEAAMRSYARRSPAFAAHLQQIASAETPQSKHPSKSDRVIAHALASAWSLGDPSFRTELEDAIRLYVRAQPAFKQSLATIRWPEVQPGKPS
ncbi:MAG: hypothetical protein H7Y32_00540 [Chloroflexales bacterium]|nr:hypothetical protein [Chloroflexales bacterium]